MGIDLFQPTFQRRTDVNENKDKIRVTTFIDRKLAVDFFIREGYTANDAVSMANTKDPDKVRIRNAFLRTAMTKAIKED